MDYKKIAKENWILITIMGIAFALMLYYFIMTTGQASWFDSAEYLSQGLHYKNQFNGITDSYVINFQRPPAFQYIIGILLWSGLGESQIIFLLCLLPSLLAVFFVYLLGKEMFNKNIGLIAAFFMAVSWNWLFWSTRAQPDMIGMCLQTLSMYFFFRAVNNKGSINWNMFWAGALSAASFNFKISGLLVPMITFAYLLSTQRFSMFKRKENWLYAFGFILLILPYLLWAWVSFGNPFIVRSGYKSTVENNNPFAWWTLNWFYTFFGDFLFFALFMIGLVWFCWTVFTKLDLELKQPSEGFASKWFIILTFIISSCFYIFYIGGIEDRWIFIWLPFLFYVSASVIVWTANILNDKAHKAVAIIFILLLLGFLAYGQVTHADSIIKNKIDSYRPVKDSAIWIKENSKPTDSFITLSYTQQFFYSERPTYTYGAPNFSNVTIFTDWYMKLRPKFLVVSVFEAAYTPANWIYAWSANNTEVTPVQVYFGDAAQTQPVLIIYKFNYPNG
jgi:4-amino-4-deoxy-L-arabinose transferase-like glycosyltransferase